MGRDRVEAVVDEGGRPLVLDGSSYRTPESAREMARAMLEAADAAEDLATS